MNKLKSTIGDPRFNAHCKHCSTFFMGFTMKDMFEHLKEHTLQTHFKDVRVQMK